MLLTIAVTAGAGAQGYSCKAADFFSDMTIRQLKWSIADTASRRALGLPNVPASQVTLAADATLCNRAMLALDTLAHSQHPTQPMPPQGTGAHYVFKVGTYTGVALLDSGSTGRISDYTPLFLFDPVWKFVNILGM
jgi:hypothetical protein